MTQTRKPCPKILIVDDDSDHSQLLSDSLMLYYEIPPDGRIVCVTNGTDCLAQPLGQFDVILLDLHLPDMTGLEVLDKILARVEVPVIFVTGENDLAVATQAIEKGAQDYVVKHGEYLLSIPAIVQKNISLHQIKMEHDELQKKIQWMLKELQLKNEQLETSMKQLKIMATTDPLTELANRRHFGEQLTRQFDEAVRYGNDLSCAMIDLDRYKQFNDTFGHQMGDKLLQATAEEIRSSLRASDIAARYGGDEFILLLPQTNITEALPVLNRIREGMVREIPQEHITRMPVTLSIGVASIKADYPETGDSLVSMADRALYWAKELGKDRVVIFSEMRRQTIETVCPSGSTTPPHLPNWVK